MNEHNKGLGLTLILARLRTQLHSPPPVFYKWNIELYDKFMTSYGRNSYLLLCEDSLFYICSVR